MPNDDRRALGALGEQLAADHLTRLDYELVERNFRTRFGELDIIAVKGSVLVFCEVKTRRQSSYWRDPLESVHPRKRQQLRRIAGQWLAQRSARGAKQLRFDVIGVTVDAQGRLLRLDHLEAAF